MADKAIRLRLETTAKGLRILDDAGNKLTKISLASKTANQGLGMLTGGVARLAVGLGAFVGSAAMIRGVHKAFKGWLDDADRVHKLSIRLSETTAFLSEMAFAADISGISTESLHKSMEKFNKGLGEAKMGIGEAKYALDSMGLTGDVLAGKITSLEQALPQLAEHFKNLKDPQLAAAQAAKLFGRSGMEMLQMLRQGPEAIEALRARARELGISIDKDMADKAALAKDRMTELMGAFTGFRNVVMVDVAPYVTRALIDITNAFITLRNSGDMGDILVSFGKVIDVLGIVFKAAFKAGQAIRAITDPEAAARWEKILAPPEYSFSRGAPKGRKKTDFWDMWSMTRLLEGAAGEGLDKIPYPTFSYPPPIQELEAVKEKAKEVESIVKDHTDALRHEYFDLNKYITKETTSLDRVYQDLAGGLQSSFSGLFTDIITGNGSMEDAFASMGQSVVREMAAIVAELMAIYLVKSLISGVGTLFGGGVGGASTGPVNSLGAIRAHDGGTITTTGLQRLHSGGAVGLRSDERLIVGQVGETMYPKGAGPSVIVNIHNEGAPLKEEYKTTRTEQGKTVVDLFLERVNTNPGERRRVNRSLGT